MRYRHLGKHGIKVSTVGLGSWLTYGSDTEKDSAENCITRAYDLGINFFDTANSYAHGRAEEIVGAVLRQFHRDSYVLATKVFNPMGSGPNDAGLSRKHIFEQVHQSLDRLGTDYIDLYQCHSYDVETPLEETCRIMDDLIRLGKVLYWGVSGWTAEQIANAVQVCRAEGWSTPVSNQPQYSALWRKPERNIFPTCEQFGLGNVVWSPLAQGVLTGKYKDMQAIPPGSRAAGAGAGFMGGFFTPEVLSAVAQLHSIAQESKCSVGQLALAWCLRDQVVSSVIVGATKVSQVDENAVAADLDLSADVYDAVSELLAPVAEF